MKKFYLGYFVAVITIAAALFTGCSDSRTGDAGTNGTNQNQQAAGNTGNNADSSTARNDMNGSANGTNASERTTAGSDVGDALGNAAGDIADGAAGAIDSVGNAIDGGTVTNRAGSLFGGNDGIGMRGAENIRGNEMMR